MKTLIITNPRGATIRTAPNTGGGSIRSIPSGAKLECQAVLTSPNGDKWALLSPIDPDTNHAWRFGSALTSAYIAVYVSGADYASVQDDESGGVDRNAVIDECIEALRKLKR